MARTKAYDRQIFNAVKNINARLLDLERKLGMDSEQYRRYVNSITAAAPAGTYNMDIDTGRIRMKTGKAAREQLKLGQVRATQKLPTAGESVRQAKAQLKKTMQQRAGEGEKVTVSDEEALQELAAKQKIQEWETDHGKLKYSDSVKAEMSEKGTKTYSELAAILDKGNKIDKRREKQRQYYAANKERINRRRRENRARRRSG